MAREDYTDSSACVICGHSFREPIRRNAEHDFWTAFCTNCGDYRITGSAFADITKTWKESKPEYFALVSHKLRKRQGSGDPPLITAAWIQEVCEGELEFPGAIEQIENLVIHMAEDWQPGEARNLDSSTCQAIVGASDDEALGWVFKQAEGYGYVDGTQQVVFGEPLSLLNCSLSMHGWQWYNEIGRHRQSNIGFMAMPYGKPELDQIVDNHFRPAVLQTGFRLMRLDENPEAGVIDNRLRVEIRRSRFLICDITHNNRGAIWEAGFAEGLGKPVIYTCEKSALKEAHFDIRNCQIVPWGADSPEEAAEALKATIRNTLPDEAILDDPEPN